jgi:ADP-heptose:LPS heptosyltransferase
MFNNQLNYYFEQLGISLLRFKIRKKLYNGAMLLNCKKDISFYENIFFFFNYYPLMHLGDQFYFKPLITKLAQMYYPIQVSPTKLVDFAFQKYLYDNKLDKRKTLFVSTILLLPQIEKQFGKECDYFLFDPVSLVVNKPISNYIVDSFFKYFCLKADERIEKDDFIDFEFSNIDKFGLKNYKKLIVLNNYVDSGKYRISRCNKDLLIKELIKNKKDACVVHLGSEADKNGDKRIYSGIVDIDLRGRTKIVDLFSILSLKNIEKIYTHDTFIMHVANLFNQKINVVFKQYYKKNENAQKRNAFLSLYKKDNSNVIVLN